MEFGKEKNPADDIINLDEKQNGTQSQRRSVRSYASRVFQESTIGMVASIVSSHSRARRCFKSLLFMLCISGFLYQCTTHLLHVLEYPTIVGVDIENPNDITVPAYTFCNNNGMKRSVFCGLYPDHCYEVGKDFCLKHYSYCGGNKTLVPKRQYYIIENALSYDEILKFGYNMSDFVSKRLLQQATGPFLRLKEEHNFTGAMICYSMHSVVHNNEIPKKVAKRKDQIPKRPPIDTLKFDVMPEETFIPGDRPGVYLSIHSPYMAVNPFVKGIFLKGGRTYKIYVSMTKDVLLEDPFTTKFINYEEIWEANNRTGPRIQEMCQEKCLLGLTMDYFNCVTPAVLYPNDERMCTREEVRPYVVRTESPYKSPRCWDQCRDDCILLKYTPDVMERHLLHYISPDEFEFRPQSSTPDNQRYVIVEIFLEDNEIMTLKYSPKYMTVEVFSAIGGFIGCWLGISLMDIVDVFGSIFTVSRYALRTSKRK